MFISALLSLIISIFLVGSGWPASDFLLEQGTALKDKLNGKVLGASEQFFLASSDQINKAGEANQLNEVLDKIVAEASQLPVPQIPQPPQLDQPMMKLPQNTSKGTEEQVPEADLPASNVAVLDCQNSNLILAKRPDRQWPIASITKLATALVFLDNNPGWETNYTIKQSDRRDGGIIYLFTGEEVKAKDLFYSSLVGSDNTATVALVKSTGMGEEQFITAMNAKMRQLGLKSTRFKDVSGLDDNNLSTAREIAILADIALSNSEISRACLTKKYEFTTSNGRKKIIYNTNSLLGDFPQYGVNILGGKTGHINAAGYCLVGKFKNDAGQEIVTVVLGADSDSARFDQTRELVKLIYNKTN